MTSEFKFKPQPGDWSLPQELKGALDPVSYAVLSEAEIDGVPVGVGFQASKDYAVLFELIETESDPTVLMGKIAETRKPWESRYPGAIMFDRVHTEIAIRMAGKGHTQEAFDLLSTVISPYEVLDGLLSISELFEDDQKSSFKDMFARMGVEPDEERQLGIERALRDDMINRTQDPNIVEVLDAKLMASGIESDPVSGWIESRRTAEPRINWGYAESLAKDNAWPEGMPDYWKRYMLLAVTEGFQQIEGGKIEDDLEGAVGIFDDFERHFGEAKVWDQMRLGMAFTSYKNRELASAKKFTATIRDPELAAGLAVMVSSFDKENAIEIAASNPDPRRAVELLTSVDEGDEDAGILKLGELIQDETVSTERKLGIMEAIRDRFTEINSLDQAIVWQDRIDELRREL